MSCIIYSKSRAIPNNIWSKIKTDVSKENTLISEYNLDNLLEYTSSNMSEIRKGFGILLKIEKKYYVLTCLHIFGQVNMEINAFFPDKKNNMVKIPLNIIRQIPEFDIAILECHDSFKDGQFKYYTENDFFKNQNDLKNVNLSILTMDNLSNNIDHHNLKIENIDIEISNFKSVIIPKIPLLKFIVEIDDIPEFSDNVDGLSGSILVKNNSLVGMVTSYNNMKLEAIPISIIYELVYTVIKNKSAILTGFYFSTKVIELEVPNKKLYYGHYITDTKDIGYQSSASIKEFRFKNNDIIFSVNDNNFTASGMIRDSNIGYDLPLDTYLMLCCYKEFVKIDVHREQTGKHKDISHKIIGKKFNDIYNINVFNNNHYIHWKGFIFTELSEELIYAINCNGVKLTGKYFEKIKTIKDDKSKLIVLLDIDYKSLNSETSKTLQHIGLPYMKYENGYTLLILERIGNKKINSINDLLSSLSENTMKTTCSYLFGNGDGYKMIVE